MLIDVGKHCFPTPFIFSYNEKESRSIIIELFYGFLNLKRKIRLLISIFNLSHLTSRWPLKIKCQCEKNRYLVLGGERSYLRSCHLVLWSLETLTGKQRLYGTRLVIQKEIYYHPLSVLPEVGCIVGFVLNC
jgi:hypothetical protein